MSAKGQATFAATVAAACLAAAPLAAFAAGLLDFTEAQRAAILQHGPWPLVAPPVVLPKGSRPTAARAFGEVLFFDTRLSPSGRVACATCHQPERAFTDALARSRGLTELARNSPTLWNSVHQRWQGWDGGADSLWAQAIRAMQDAREMASHADHVRQTLVQQSDLACAYVQAFGRHPAHHDAETTMVHAAQALGAFVATLVSPRTPFDDFRDALARGDKRRAARYPLQAQEGLRLFVGKGQCSVCHLGPLFSNGEFADIGLPFFSQPGVVDPGRYGGLEFLRASPYTRLSRWSLAAGDATTTRHVEQWPRNFGEFKVPSLRLVAQTPPYMHDGQLRSLQEVISHYDQINVERLHADGEQILRPLHLSEAERAQLLAFLRTLSSPAVTRWQRSREPATRHACAGPAEVVRRTRP